MGVDVSYKEENNKNILEQDGDGEEDGKRDKHLTTVEESSCVCVYYSAQL